MLSTLQLDNHIPGKESKYKYVKGPYMRKNLLYPIVPIDSAQFRKFIDFMR
jgi:hypothetical protein